MKTYTLQFILILISSYGYSYTIHDLTKENKMTSPSDSISVAAYKMNKLKKFTVANFSPFGQNASSNQISSASVVSTFNKGENAKIDLKYKVKRLIIGLGAEQQLGKGASSATLFDMNGVNSGTTIKFNLQQMFWKPIVISDEDFGKFQKAKRSFAARKGIEDERTIMLSEIEADANAEERAYLKGIRQRSPLYFNVECAVSKLTFSYTEDSVSLVPTSKSVFAPSFTLSLIKPFINSHFESYLAIRYNYSEGYEENEPTTFLSPFGKSGNAYSSTLIFGEPSKYTDNKVNMEFRLNLHDKKNGQGPWFGIAPSITYGIESNKMAAYIPVYFVRGEAGEDGKPGGLQGGIRFGYTSSTKANKWSSFKDGFIAQVIVTLPFEVLNKL